MRNARRFYAHDSRNPEHPKDSWIETELDWDAEAKCYVVTIRTNDTTDANRIAQLIPLGTFWGAQ